MRRGAREQKRPHNEKWEAHCLAITPVSNEVMYRVVESDATQYAGIWEADSPTSGPSNDMSLLIARKGDSFFSWGGTTQGK
jgi:hypothetical protein